MRRWTLLLPLVALLAAAPAFGQGAYVNPYVGALLLSDSELEGLEDDFEITIDPSLLVGARLGTMVRQNWMLEAAFGYSPVSAEAEAFGETGEIDGTAMLYYGALGYAFPTSGKARIFLSAGGGILSVGVDEIEGEDPEIDDSSDFIATLGAGLLWAVNDRLGVRLDVKDHLAFCSGIDEDSDEDAFSLCPAEDKTLSHFEISGGVTFGLGG